jgi:DUF1680 family protein
VIGERTEEGCTTYNMQKLALHLFHWSGDPALMDFYELTFFSSLLSHINIADGRKLYYLPLGVLPQPAGERWSQPGLGYQKAWMDPYSGFLCCQGTMTESAAKLGEATYQLPGVVPQPGANTTILVSQFVSSVMDIEGVARINQSSSFPESPNATTSLQISCSRINRSSSSSDSGHDRGVGHGGGPLTIAIRIPSWASSGHNTVLFDGSPVGPAAAPPPGTSRP